MKKEASKGCVFLLKRKCSYISHIQPSPWWPEERVTSCTQEKQYFHSDTDGSGWSILSFASGSKAHVQSIRTSLLRLLSTLLPHLWSTGLHIYDMFLVNWGSFWSNRSLQSSLSLRTHEGIYHTAPQANLCYCPLFLDLVCRHSIPVLPKESQGVTAVYWVLHQGFCTYDYMYSSSPTELHGDLNITDIEEQDQGHKDLELNQSCSSLSLKVFLLHCTAWFLL